MISVEDCVAMCGLDLDEIAAIAEHEHVPEIAAAALGRFLLHKAGGEAEIRRMLVEEIRKALTQNRLQHATELLMALRHFMTEHPGAGLNCDVDQAAEAIVGYAA
jgi:hypothetical protein